MGKAPSLASCSNAEFRKEPFQHRDKNHTASGLPHSYRFRIYITFTSKALKKEQ